MRTNRVERNAERRTLGGQARRSQLIDCAVQSLCEVGYARTSVAEVARRAGVSKGVVTYHFPTKDELLGQVVTSLYERVGSRISARVAAEETAMGQVAGYIEENIALIAEHAAHVRAVMQVLANLRRPDGAPALTPRAEDPVLAHLRIMIERGQAAGELAPIDAGVLATVLRASIDAAAARAATDPSFDQSRYARELVLVAKRTLRTDHDADTRG